MAGVLAIDGGYNWRTAPVPIIRRRPRIPAHHAALWFGGSVVRGFVRRHPYLSAAGAAAALGLGAYRFYRRKSVRKMAETPRYPAAKRQKTEDSVKEARGAGGYTNDFHHKKTRRLGRVNLRKLAREGVHNIYDRYQMMGLYGKQTGLISLAKDKAVIAQDGTTTIANAANAPVCLFDLTCTRNNVAGTQYVPNVGYQLYRDTAAGSLVWNHLRGQNITTGVAGTDKGTVTYQVFSAPRALANLDSPLDNGILDWVRCQFVFFGAKKTSHKIWVDVCQLDGELQPRAQSVNLGQLPSDALSATGVVMGCDEQTSLIDGQQWWTNECSRLMDSPFATYGSKVKKLRFKILSRKQLEFSPVSSYEEAGSALCHKQSLNLYLKMGRKCDFAWRNDAQPGASILGDANIETDVEAGQHACYVHPNARVFLMVRSQVFNKVGDDAAFTTDADVAPSFDIRITRKWLISS